MSTIRQSSTGQAAPSKAQEPSRPSACTGPSDVARLTPIYRPAIWAFGDIFISKSSSLGRDADARKLVCLFNGDEHAQHYRIDLSRGDALTLGSMEICTGPKPDLCLAMNGAFKAKLKLLK